MNTALTPLAYTGAMPNLGAPEILIILLVALLVFGPRKLPELGKSIGAGLREFRRSTQGLKEEFDGALRDTGPATSSAAPVQPAPVQVVAAQPQIQAAQGVPVAAAAVIPQQAAHVTPAAVTPAQVVPEAVKQDS